MVKTGRKVSPDLDLFVDVNTTQIVCFFSVFLIARGGNGPEGES